MESEVVLDGSVRQRRGSLIQRLIDTLNDSGPWLGNRVLATDAPPPPTLPTQPKQKSYRSIGQRFPRAPLQGGIVERQLQRLSAMDWWGSDARFARDTVMKEDASDFEEELSYDSDEELQRQQQQQQWSITPKGIDDQAWQQPTMTKPEQKLPTFPTDGNVQLNENVWTDKPGQSVSRLAKISFAEELEKALMKPPDTTTVLDKQRREPSTFEHMALSRPTPLLQRRRQRRRPKLAPDLPSLPNFAVFADAVLNDDECDGTIHADVQDSVTDSDGVESCVSDQVAPADSNVSSSELQANGVEDKQDVWAEGRDDSELVDESNVVPVLLLPQMERRADMQEQSTAATNLGTPANSMDLVLTATREQDFKQEPALDSPRQTQEKAVSVPQIVLSDDTAWTDTELSSLNESRSLRRRIASTESMETRWRHNLRNEAKRKSADINDSIVSQILRRVDRSVRTSSSDAGCVQSRHLSPARTSYPEATEVDDESAQSHVAHSEETSTAAEEEEEAAASPAAEVEVDESAQFDIAHSEAAPTAAAEEVEIDESSHAVNSEAASTAAKEEEAAVSTAETEEVEMDASSQYDVAHSEAAPTAEEEEEAAVSTAETEEFEIDASSQYDVAHSEAAPTAEEEEEAAVSTAETEEIEIDASSQYDVAHSKAAPMAEEEEEAAASTAAEEEEAAVSTAVAEEVDVDASSQSQIAHSEASSTEAEEEAAATASEEEKEEETAVSTAEVDIDVSSQYDLVHSEAAAEEVVEMVLEVSQPAPSSLSLRVRSSSLTSSEGSDSIREMPNDEELDSEFEMSEADTRRTLVEALELQKEKMHALAASLEKVDHNIFVENQRLGRMENALKVAKARRISVVTTQKSDVYMQLEQQELMKGAENGRRSCQAVEAESREAVAQLVRLQGEKTLDLQRYRTEVLHSLYEVNERERVAHGGDVDRSAEAALLMSIEVATDKLESVQTQIGWLRERHARANERTRQKEERQHEENALLETFKHELEQLDEEVERAESVRQHQTKRACELHRTSVENARKMQVERRAARTDEKQKRATVKQLIFNFNTRRTGTTLMRSQTRETTERTDSGIKSIRRHLKSLQHTLNSLGRKKSKKKRTPIPDSNAVARAGNLAANANCSIRHNKTQKTKKRWKSLVRPDHTSDQL